MLKWLGFHVLQLPPIMQRLNLSCISKSQIETWTYSHFVLVIGIACLLVS